MSRKMFDSDCRNCKYPFDYIMSADGPEFTHIYNSLLCVFAPSEMYYAPKDNLEYLEYLNEKKSQNR